MHPGRGNDARYRIDLLVGSYRSQIELLVAEKIFFGTVAAVVTVGACVPLLFGKETVGQLEMVTAAAPEPGKA